MDWSEDDSTEDAKAKHAKSMLFPIGEPNDGFARYFIGQSYLALISSEQVGIFNVTFEPGCRNNWYTHHAVSAAAKFRFQGQILLMSGWKQ